MYITKLNLAVDLDKVQTDLDNILNTGNWIPHNQIGIKHRPNADNIWKDAIGGLFSLTGERLANESDFSLWNWPVPTYTQTVIEELEKLENFKTGRIRFMRQMPKTGLSIHFDFDIRYHLVLDTNPGALFGFSTDDVEEVAKCYHVPKDGHFYKIDTRHKHFVYNAGSEPRIHLVICSS
jgi:hypothetical protein